MRALVAALLVLLVVVPAARADVSFTGVPASPTNLKTFDVGFTSEGAVRFDCVHVFPDLGASELPGCSSPFEFRDLVDGRHELTVTATDAEGVKTQRSISVVVDTVEPPAPTIETASVDQRTATLSGTTAAGTTVAVFEGPTKLGDATVTGETWTFAATNLTRGTHTLTAVASDAAGNASPASAPRAVTIAGAPATPTIDLPVEGAALRQRKLTLSGRTEAGTTVVVFDGETELGRTTADGTTWAFTTPVELTEGAHTLKAVATDAGGDSPAAVRHVTIDTVVPEVTFFDVPVSPTNRFTFDIGFGASEPARFDCVHVFPDGTSSEQLDCHSAFEMRELEDGTHELRVTATDAAGNQRTRSVAVTIDTQAPVVGEPAQTGTSEFTFGGEAGATFECSVDGAVFAACTSPQRLSGLAPGAHTFAVRAVDAAGNRSEPTARAFAIAETPAATPEPSPVATAATVPAVLPPAAPTAQLGRTLVARTVSGKVYVRRPATAALLDLGTVAGIPVGTEIDARRGRVRLTAAARPGKAAHRAEFFGGMFVVTQAGDDVVDLRLSEPFGSCARKTGTRVRKLWGDGKGRFRTRGLNSVTTVRGTRWLVQDTCDGTLTRVSQGVVSVRDSGKRKTFLVRAGRKHLAARKRK